MSKTRQPLWTTAPAKLTDIDVGRRQRAKGADRKSGDLTKGAAERIARVVARGETVPRASAWAAGAAVAPDHPEIAKIQRAPAFPARSDVFDFGALAGDEPGIVSEAAVDAARISRRSRTPASLDFADAPDDGTGASDYVEVISSERESDTAASTADSGSSATEWCLVEQPHLSRTSAVRDREVQPKSTVDAPNLVIIDQPGKPGEMAREMGASSWPQIITMVMGALLILTGVVLVTAPMWHEAYVPSFATKVTSDARGTAWFGLALVLIGATLEVIGLRARRNG